MKLHKTFQITFVCLLLCSGVLTHSAHAQQQGFRWGKWSAGQTDQGTVYDKVVDSYVDSVGNTYILGAFGMAARLGQNGPYINHMDSTARDMGYRISNNQGIYLAKIDSLGNILWCRSARYGARNSGCAPLNNMVVKDGRITIAFSNYKNGAMYDWFYFFDTLILEPSYPRGNWDRRTYFVTFDLNGNRLDAHAIQLFAFDDLDYINFRSCPFSSNSYSGSRFLIDEDGNIHIFACSSFSGEDSLHQAYIIVDEDTNRKHPLNIKTMYGKTYSTSVYYKLDSNWNPLESRFLIDSVTKWHPGGSRMTNLEIKNAVIEGDAIYASCFFYSKDNNFQPDTFSVKVFLDSVHYLKVDNAGDWRGMPCLLKMNRDGEVLWVQQLYNDSRHSLLGNYNSVGGIAVDDQNAYNFCWPSWGDETRFYIDSAHNTRVPRGPINFCLIVSYNRNTGEPIDYYIVDTINKNLSDNSLESIGDELILNVGFRLLYKTELCKINKNTKEVTRLSPIKYVSTSLNCKSMSANDHGWVFRGEMGKEPRVYDSIFIGNYQEAVVMTFFYDSTLDKHRLRPCPRVDTLWCDEVDGTTATLRWSSRSGHAGYELAYIAEGGSWDEAAVVETADTAATVALPAPADIAAGATGPCTLFRVRALCDADHVAHSPWSSPVTVCPPVGIDPAESPSAFSLHPNPTAGKVTVTTSATVVSATLTDLTGRRERVRLEPAGPGHYTLDLAGCPPAAYLLTLTTADGTQHTLRLLKLPDTSTE